MAVADVYGDVKLMVSTSGMPPASVDQAIKKARTAALFNVFPAGALNATVRPSGSLFGLASSLGGLVTYSGLAPLADSAGNALGGIGVFSEGPLTVDDAVAVAGASAVAAAGAGSGAVTLQIPAFSARANIDPLGMPYAGAYTSAVELWAACQTALAAFATNSTCTARDGTGAVRVIAREDNAALASLDLSLQMSRSSFGFPHPSGAFQAGVAPDGMYYTATYAEDVSKHEFYTAVPGGMPLQDPLLGALVGSLAISSGLQSAANDTAAAALGVQAFAQVYPGNQLTQATINFQCQSMVELYNAHVNVGNFSGAAALTLAPTVQYTIPGPGLPYCPV